MTRSPCVVTDTRAQDGEAAVKASHSLQFLRDELRALAQSPDVVTASRAADALAALNLVGKSLAFLLTRQSARAEVA